jgi:serine phosphatase RsbU (regulator of sigma subunit)
MLPFTSVKFQPTNGQMIYLFSDGYVDQFGGEDGKKLNSNRMKEILEKVSDLDCKKQLLAIEEEYTKWKGSIEQVDDICVLGLRV